MSSTYQYLSMHSVIYVPDRKGIPESKRAQELKRRLCKPGPVTSIVDAPRSQARASQKVLHKSSQWQKSSEADIKGTTCSLTLHFRIFSTWDGSNTPSLTRVILARTECSGTFEATWIHLVYDGGNVSGRMRKPYMIWPQLETQPT